MRLIPTNSDERAEKYHPCHSVSVIFLINIRKGGLKMKNKIIIPACFAVAAVIGAGLIYSFMGVGNNLASETVEETVAEESCLAKMRRGGRRGGRRYYLL